MIIAGFGRFGQIAGRLLLSSGVKMVILDHDPDHVDTLRKFDMKVFYGDATRADLLESAGAAKAEVLINAIDDPETSMQMVELVKEHFPHLTIISRARDVDHYIQLRQAGWQPLNVKPSKGRSNLAAWRWKVWGLVRMKRVNVPICSAALTMRWWKRWWRWRAVRQPNAQRCLNAPAPC